MLDLFGPRQSATPSAGRERRWMPPAPTALLGAGQRPTWAFSVGKVLVSFERRFGEGVGAARVPPRLRRVYVPQNVLVHVYVGPRPAGLLRYVTRKGQVGAPVVILPASTFWVSVPE